MRRTAVTAFIVAAFSASGSAQDAKSFKIRWYGQSFFQVETPLGKRIVFDPHAIPFFGRNLVPADVIVCTHLHNDHAQPEVIEGFKAARVFYGLEEKGKGRPADWKRVDEKVGGVRVRNVGTYHDADNGMRRGKNSVFVVEAEGLTVCHLGDLGHELTPDQVRAIGPVDVLMVPVGGTYTINGDQAKATVRAIKPRLLVLPMHYGVPGYDDLNGPDEFLDGQPNVKRLPATNELVVPADGKADAPAVVLLGWKKE